MPKPVDEFAAEVGGRVRAQRLLRGWSIRELAEKAGLSTHVQLLHIEQGRCGLRMHQLVKLADLFAVTTDWLLGREEPY